MYYRADRRRTYAPSNSLEVVHQLWSTEVYERE